MTLAQRRLTTMLSLSPSPSRPRSLRRGHSSSLRKLEVIWRNTVPAPGRHSPSAVLAAPPRSRTSLKKDPSPSLRIPIGHSTSARAISALQRASLSFRRLKRSRSSTMVVRTAHSFRLVINCIYLPILLTISYTDRKPPPTRAEPRRLPPTISFRPCRRR